jgi:ABC-type lipoprotein export system ATPase subunit
MTLARPVPAPVAANTGREPVFVAQDLTKIYRMGEVQVAALRGVDLEIYAGELIVLLGPSGSGKSTLLNILGGLDVPSGGRAFWRDHNLVTADEAELTRYRREHVGFVFQFYNLIPSLTARENVALVTEMVARPMTPEEALQLVDLGERLDHFPAQLSGGEQGVEEQRVNVIIDFAAPTERLINLGDAYRVDARIVVASAEDALKVPIGAPFRESDHWTVFVIDGSHANKRVIKLGKRNGVEAVVEEGLKAGELVVLHPSDSVKDGSRVATRLAGASGRCRPSSRVD